MSGHEDKREAGEGCSNQGNDSTFPPAIDCYKLVATFFVKANTAGHFSRPVIQMVLHH